VTLEGPGASGANEYAGLEALAPYGQYTEIRGNGAETTHYRSITRRKRAKMA